MVVIKIEKKKQNDKPSRQANVQVFKQAKWDIRIKMKAGIKRHNLIGSNKKAASYVVIFDLNKYNLTVLCF